MQLKIRAKYKLPTVLCSLEYQCQGCSGSTNRSLRDPQLIPSCRESGNTSLFPRVLIALKQKPFSLQERQGWSLSANWVVLFLADTKAVLLRLKNLSSLCETTIFTSDSPILHRTRSQEANPGDCQDRMPRRALLPSGDSRLVTGQRHTSFPGGSHNIRVVTSGRCVY